MSGHLIFAAFIGSLPVIAACATEEIDESTALDESAELGEVASGLEGDPVAGEAALTGEAAVADEEGTFAEAKPKAKKPEFTDNGLTITAEGKLEDLDKKGDVFIRLSCTAKAIAKCTNPGGHEPPGKNPVVIDDFEVNGAATFPAWQIHFGKLSFEVTTKPPKKQIPGATDCPNPNWKETLVDLKFQKCRIIVRQNNKLVQTTLCSFDKPTEDGHVPDGKVSCLSF